MSQNEKIAISIVNYNCLEHTKNLINDLDRQSYSNYVVYFYDQGSREPGTKDFLTQLSYRKNYRIFQNGKNKPLNHIWNDFANDAKAEFDILTFLNNDIRVPFNYLEDTVNILKDRRIGIAIHATNNKDFKMASTPTRYIFDTTHIKQGWEFSLHASEWKDIPEILKFYCGDDFIFHQMHKSKRYIGIAKSSPVIHKLSQTREAMGSDFIDDIKKQALLDIDNYKKLGFPHSWNNISKFSKLSPEMDQIIELSGSFGPHNFLHYENRLKQHLNGIKQISGNILDVGIHDAPTFNALLNAAIDQNKKLLGIDSADVFSKDIVSGNTQHKIAEQIKIDGKFSQKSESFEILNSGFLKDINELNSLFSFIFVGCLDKIKLHNILPKLWASLESGGTMFFPYYHNNSEIFEVVNNFLSDRQVEQLSSRIQTKPGVKDVYLAVKKFNPPIAYTKRTKPLIVASVLKTGGVYDVHYVNKLASAVKRHTTVDYKFVCLTDAPTYDIDTSLVNEVIPLRYGLPKWWSKLELFRPELFPNSQILYFDLDTLIVDNIDDFTTFGGDFLALRDFNTLLGMGSGILGWDANKCHHIFYKFMEGLVTGKINIKQFSGGDQEAIERFLELTPNWVQDCFPRKMSAFKYECFDSATETMFVPKNASVICFHGTPKMGDLTNDPVIIENWK